LDLKKGDAMTHPNGMPTHEEMRTMSEEALAEKIDQQYGLTPDARHLLLAQTYRDELARRENAKITNTMLRYTQQMRNLTIVILLATLVNIAVVLMGPMIDP
jgi:hypothetical protein